MSNFPFCGDIATPLRPIFLDCYIVNIIMKTYNYYFILRYFINTIYYGILNIKKYLVVNIA